MSSRFWWLIALLLVAALACNLSSGDDNPAVDDSAPTSLAAQPSPTFAAPSPTPTLPATPLPGVPTNTPGTTCTVRTDWPTITVQQGDTLSAIAQRVNSTVDELMRANCLANADQIIAGMPLRVPSVPAASPAPTNPNCANRWFFTFVAGMEDRRGLCPNPVIQVNAVGQNFEGGRVYRYDPLPGTSDPRGTIYVIYNDGTWETYPDTWTPGDIESDPTITAPRERYQPVRSIGKVWRDNPDVRRRLGWAYEPEQAFVGRFQEPSGFAGIWNGYTPYFYVDHGAFNVVLRLYSVDMGPNTWEVAGRY